MFVPAPGLRSPHAQTIFGSLMRRYRGPRTVRTRLETPDGDFVDVETLEAKGRPHVVLFHGLEGSARSGYILAALDGAAARGWGATAINFRSCSGEPNKLLRSYSSGDTGDPIWLLERLPQPLFAIGFSLGANVLLRVLAEQGDRTPIAAAVAISTPFDLAACARAIDAPGPFNLLYRERFLRTLRAKALEKAARFGTLDPALIRATKTMTGFDDAVTAPIWGFGSASEYYAHCSSGKELEKIRRPTLLLSSKDDPIIPKEALPEVSNPMLTTEWTEHGGHNGFVAGSMLRPIFWAEERALRFLSSAPTAPR